jgi:hypothetical protein
MDDGTVYKEYTEDASFVRDSRDHPPPSFRVGCDLVARYFLTLYSASILDCLGNHQPEPRHLSPQSDLDLIFGV